MEEEAMNVKENREGHMGRFGEKKGRERCNCIIVSKVKMYKNCVTFNLKKIAPETERIKGSRKWSLW